RKSRADLPAEAELAVAVNADEERAQVGASPLGLRVSPDHELLPGGALDLDPVAPPPGAVRRVGALRHDALEPFGARAPEELGTLPAHVLTEPDRFRKGASRQNRRERALSPLEREPAEIVPFEREQIEQVEDHALGRA